MTTQRVIGPLALLLVLVSPLGAAEVRSGQEARIEAGETIGDDVFMTGDTITIDGHVEGDVIAFGRHIVVNGVIDGDLISAGQAIVVAGRVLDDARIAGMVLKVAGEVGDDVQAAGMSLETTAGSRVGGSLTFRGFQTLLAGEVIEGADVAGQGIELRGRVGGDFVAEAGQAVDAPWIQTIPTPESMPSVGGGLELTESASVAGDLSYSAPQEASVVSGARIGGETRAEMLSPAAAAARTPRQRAGKWLQRLVSLLVVGALALWLLPSLTNRQARELRVAPAKCFLTGLVGVPAAGVLFLLLVAITILVAVLFGYAGLGSLSGLTVLIGISSGVVLFLALFIGLLYCAQILVGIGAGGALLGRVRESPSPWLALGAGVLLYTLLRLVPMVGTVIGLLVVLFGFGAVVRTCWIDWRQRGSGDLGDEATLLGAD